MNNDFQKEHSEEISASRVGGFGGSDAAMFYRVGLNGLSALTQTDVRRIRVAKGIEPYIPIPSSAAMQKGHDFEDWMAAQHPDAEREVRLEMSLAIHFDTFAHADFVYTDSVYELKCVQEPQKAESKYAAQLQWYYMMGAKAVTLVVQDSSKAFGEDMQQIAIDRDYAMIRIIAAGIALVDEAWNDETVLCVREDVTADELLPFDREAVKVIYETFRTIKEMEERAATAKEQLLRYMETNGIRSIKNDALTISYVGESVRRAFDKKALQQAHPELDLSEYEKESKVKSSIKINLK